MMFRVVSTLLLLQLVASRISHKVNRDMMKNNGRCFDVQSTCEGTFRDPIEILGMKFPGTLVQHLCKANLYMFADKITDVSYPNDSVKLCRAVCVEFLETMELGEGVKVSCVTSNCDYTGDVIIKEHLADSKHPAKCPDLSTACSCMYKVQCNYRTRPVMYTFTPNRHGFVKVGLINMAKTVYVNMAHSLLDVSTAKRHD